MATEMTSTALASIIVPELIAEARLAFQNDANMVNFVRVQDLTGSPTKTASWPIFIAAGVTTPGSETTDVTTNQDITPTDVTAAVDRKTIKIMPSDLGWASSNENMSQILGQIIGKARAKKVDTDILAVMTTNYTSSVGATNSTDLSFANIASALLTLETNESNQNLVLVLHPKQWNHLRGDLVVVSGTTTNPTGDQATQAFTNGVIGTTVFGAKLIITPRVGTGTDTNAMYLGVLGNLPESIGYAVKDCNASLGLPPIELERDASIGATEVVMNYYDKAAIIRATGLVLVKSQTY